MKENSYTVSNKNKDKLSKRVWPLTNVVVVYHVTIVAVGLVLLKKYWTTVICCFLSTAGSFII